jgi:hypothetical protein
LCLPPPSIHPYRPACSPFPALPCCSRALANFHPLALTAARVPRAPRPLCDLSQSAAPHKITCWPNTQHPRHAPPAPLRAPPPQRHLLIILAGAPQPALRRASTSFYAARRRTHARRRVCVSAARRGHARC